MSAHPRRRSAFTLVEISIAIVVIGVLATAGWFGYRQWEQRTWRSVLLADLSRYVREEEARRTTPAETPTDTTRRLATQTALRQLARTQLDDRYWLVLRHDPTAQTCWVLIHPTFPEGNGSPSCGVMPDTTVVPTGPIGQPPVADLEITPATPLVGDVITLSGTGSTDPDGTITSYQFSGLPGLPAAGPTATVTTTVSTPGSYTVVLRVVDSDGNPALISRPLVVQSLPADGTASTLSATPLSFPQGDSAQVLVTARTTGGVAVVAAAVQLTATGASHQLRQPTGGTDTNGQATGWVRGLAQGAVTVQATVGGVPISTPVTLTVTPPAVSGSTSTISANPASVLIDQFSSLTVTARTSSGGVIPGVPVVLAMTGGPGGAELLQPTEMTDTLGRATGYVRHATLTGVLTVSATAGGVAVATPATVTVGARAPTQIIVVAGDSQRVAPSTAVPIAPRVRVLDQAGAPLGSTAVTVGVLSGGGALTSATGVTNSSGEFTLGSWTVGASGPQQLQAVAGPASTTITALVRRPSAVVVIEGAGQRVVPSTLVPIAPQVEVRDSTSAPMEGVVVTFAATGGTTTGDIVTTDATGRARVGSWTTGTGTTGQQLTATVAGGATATIPITIRRAAIVRFIEPTLGTVLSTRTWGPLTAVTPVPTAEVLDQDSLPMAAIPLTFSQTGGLVLGATTATTDLTGRTTPTSVTLPSGAGSRVLTATVTGSSPVVSGTQTITATQAQSATIVSGNNQVIASDGTAAPYTIPQPFRIRVMSGTAGTGTPVPGARVICWNGSAANLRVSGAALTCNTTNLASPGTGATILVSDASGEILLSNLTATAPGTGTAFGDFSPVGGPGGASNAAQPAVSIRIRRPFGVIPVSSGFTTSSMTPWTSNASGQDTLTRRVPRGGSSTSTFRVVDSTGTTMGAGWTVNIAAGNSGPGWNTLPATATTDAQGEFQLTSTFDAAAASGYWNPSFFVENVRVYTLNTPTQRGVAPSWTMTITHRPANVRRVEPLSGFGQAVGQTSDLQDIRFRVLDAVNAPMPGVTVTATTVSAGVTRIGGGSWTADAAGIVTIPAGTYRTGTPANGTQLSAAFTVGSTWATTATTAGSPAGWSTFNNTSATWTAYAYATGPTAVVVLSDSAQAGGVGQTLRPVRVRIVNASNQGVAGATITSVLASGDVTYTGPTTMTTDGNGEASVGAWAMNPTVNPWAGPTSTLGIQVAGLSGTRTIATVQRVTPRIDVISGNNQQLPLGTALGPVRLRVIDEATNAALSNIPLTITPGQNMVLTSPSVLTTDAAGEAIVTGLAIDSTWAAWSTQAQATVTAPGASPAFVIATLGDVVVTVDEGNFPRLFPRECTTTPILLGVRAVGGGTPIVGVTVRWISSNPTSNADGPLYRGAASLVTDVNGQVTLPPGTICMHGNRNVWAAAATFRFEVPGQWADGAPRGVTVSTTRIVPTPETVTLPPTPPGSGVPPVSIPVPRDPVTNRPCPVTLCQPQWDPDAGAPLPLVGTTNPIPGGPTTTTPTASPPFTFDPTGGRWTAPPMVMPSITARSQGVPCRINQSPYTYISGVTFDDGMGQVYRYSNPVQVPSQGVPSTSPSDGRNWLDVGASLSASLRVLAADGSDMTGALLNAGCFSASAENSDPGGEMGTSSSNEVSATVPNTRSPNRGPGTSPVVPPTISVNVSASGTTPNGGGFNFAAGRWAIICSATNSYPKGSLHCPEN